MFKLSRTLIQLVILLVVAGCAGKDFVRPDQAAFKLGTTTYSQVVQQLGEPRHDGTTIKNDKTVRSIGYSYATTTGEPPLESDAVPARALAYYFVGDTLVGQEFQSSFKSDHSDFDETKIGSLIKGKTTRAEVVQLLGRPSGSYIPPMVKATAGEALGYAYTVVKGNAFSGLKVFKKALLVSFDERDLVSDIEYSSSGTK